MSVSDTDWRKSSSPPLARKMRVEAFTTGGSAVIQLALQAFDVYRKGIYSLMG
jgi:hypothetical protein